MQMCVICNRAGIQKKRQVGMRIQRRFKSASASAQSDQCLRLRTEETLHSWLPIECPLKTLIRLRVRAG